MVEYADCPNGPALRRPAVVVRQVSNRQISGHVTPIAGLEPPP